LKYLGGGVSRLSVQHIRTHVSVDLNCREGAAASLKVTDEANALGVQPTVVRRRAIDMGLAPCGGISKTIGGKRGSTTRNEKLRKERARAAHEDIDRIKTALISSGGRICVAAMTLSISDQTLRRRIRALGLQEWLEQGAAGGSQFRRPTLVKRRMIDSRVVAATT
jgi:transcriptional regulator with GAF, ATPase, and Fis domain